MKSIMYLLCILWTCSTAMAQHGSIQGRVIDETRHPMAGAVITVQADSPRTTIKLITGADGRFAADSLPGTRYRVKAERIGYKECLIRNLPLTAGQNTTVNFIMDIVNTTMNEPVVVAWKAPAGGTPAGIITVKASEAAAQMSRGSTPSVSTAAGVYPAGATPMPPAAGMPIQAGQLTAGEINDFSKWKLWSDVSGLELWEWQNAWKIYPSNRYTVMLTDNTNKPVANAIVRLKRYHTREVIWETRTDNTGKAELWDKMFSKQHQAGALYADVEYNKVHYPIDKLQEFNEKINTLQLPVACLAPQTLDIAFVVDATGSMQDEINYLKAELADVIQQVKASLPGIKLRTGCVVYRDRWESYLTKYSPLSEDISQAIDFMNSQNAGGGDDGPEAVDRALQHTYDDLQWDSTAVARIVFLVLDAPPRHKERSEMERLQRYIALLAAKGIRIVPLACSGTDKSTGYLLRSIALATNGTYLYVTDHSGTARNAAPVDDKYRPGELNSMMAGIVNRFATYPGCGQAPAVPADTGRIRKPQPDPAGDDESGEEAPLAVKYWPTPTNGVLNIDAGDTEGEIFIGDITGKLVMKARADDKGSVTVNMSAFPSGQYYVKFVDDEDNDMTGNFVLAR